MKKIIYTSLFVLATNISAFAQAVLPTTWNFATATLPTGWSELNVNSTTTPYYNGSGNPQPAYKFDVSGDMLTIDFTTPPGNLTYDIKANTANSAQYSSSFKVEESADGNTWTTLHNHSSMSITAYTPTTDVPLSTTRHIRFNLVTKASGNVGLDNVKIVAGVSTAALMAIKQGATPILNGGTYTLGCPLSSMLSTTFTIQNLGTVSSLNVTSANITGPAASDFSLITSMPMGPIAARDSSSLVVNFTPSAGGTRNAILSIANNDLTANPYIINLNGVGGTLASEPTAQATNLTFSAVKSYRLSATFTAASPAADGYLVLRRTGAAITDFPTDGVVYKRGDMIGSSKVVYSSSSKSFAPNEIVANTQYYFSVYAYNGVGTFRNYLISSPLSGSVTTLGSMQAPSYYSGISVSNSSFVTDLHAKINPHTLQFYSSYGPLLASTYYTRDTTNDQRVITCVYSGLNQVYTEPWDWTTYDFSREHTYCSSWMATVNDPNYQSLPEYNDYHMLAPTNQTDVNAVRSNFPLGVVVGTPVYSYLGCKKGVNAAGKTVFEPRDADKGDAARRMLYECITYTGVSFTGPAGTPGCTWGGSWSLPSNISNSIQYKQDQNVLKLWNTQDPVDNFEIGRNDLVDSLQGNRNPFIDHPEYICSIDFSNMTYLAVPNCTNVGVNEFENNDAISFAPNPSNGNFIVNYTASKNKKVSIKLYDMVARVVYSNTMDVSIGINSNEINVLSLNKGIYTVEIVSETEKQTQKLVIQ